MRSSFSKILAIAWTEFRFGLRRGGPVVAIVVISLVITGVSLYVAYLNLTRNDLSADYSPMATAGALAMAWPGFIWMTLAVLPMVCSSAFPADKQHRVHELLASYTISGWIYLAGKVLGTWAALLFVGMAGLLVYLALNLIFVGPLDLAFLLELTFLSGIPLILWAAALGVFSGVFFTSRRTALAVGFLVGLLSVYPTTQAARILPDFSSFQTLEQRPVVAARLNTITRFIPADYVFYQFPQYHLIFSYYPPVSALQVWQVLGSGVLVLGFLFALSRVWLLYKENF